MVQTLCDKAGLPQPRNRDAAGFITHSPWCKPPKAELPEPKIVSSEVISKCYESAALMETPVIGRVKPGAWWRALLVFAYNTGLRSRAIFGLRWKDVDFKNRRITVPKEIIKSRRRVVLPMNDVLIAHLRTIQGARDLVFERPWTKEAFRMALYKLQNLAEVPKSQRFQLHRLRKTCATELFRLDPGAAQLMMGHRNIGMTIDHYTNAPAALTNAVASMPQPAAFTAST
jgi:integrase